MCLRRPKEDVRPFEAVVTGLHELCNTVAEIQPLVLRIQQQASLAPRCYFLSVTVQISPQVGHGISVISQVSA